MKLGLGEVLEPAWSNDGTAVESCWLPEDRLFALRSRIAADSAWAVGPDYRARRFDFVRPPGRFVRSRPMSSAR